MQIFFINSPETLSSHLYPVYAAGHEHTFGGSVQLPPFWQAGLHCAKN